MNHNLKHRGIHLSKYEDGGSIRERALNKLRTIFTNTFDASDYDNFSDAYSAARSNGNKTFVWNGRQYSTDYAGDYHRQYEADVKSGKAQQWASENPGFANPILVKAKQEELNTYGITNEQTRDRNLVEDRMVNNLAPYGYDNAISRLFSTIVLDRSEPRRSTSTPERLDAFNLLLGKPQERNTFEVSKYRPSGAEQDYYLSNINYDYNRDKVNVYEKGTELLNNGVPSGQYTRGELIGRELRSDYGNTQELDTDLMGTYVKGVTLDYVSYYDKWDIDPFGQGNDKPLIGLGTPLNIYNREYRTNPIIPTYESGGLVIKEGADFENLDPELRSILQEFSNRGVNLRVTSGKSTGGHTTNSKHYSGNAVDITPVQGETYDQLLESIRKHPDLISRAQNAGYGILDEVKGGGKQWTGAHLHIGTDSKIDKNSWNALTVKQYNKIKQDVAEVQNLPVFNNQKLVDITPYQTIEKTLIDEVKKEVNPMIKTMENLVAKVNTPTETVKEDTQDNIDQMYLLSQQQERENAQKLFSLTGLNIIESQKV